MGFWKYWKNLAPTCIALFLFNGLFLVEHCNPQTEVSLKAIEQR